MDLIGQEINGLVEHKSSHLVKNNVYNSITQLLIGFSMIMKFYYEFYTKLEIIPGKYTTG